MFAVLVGAARVLFQLCHGKSPRRCRRAAARDRGSEAHSPGARGTLQWTLPQGSQLRPHVQAAKHGVHDHVVDGNAVCG